MSAYPKSECSGIVLCPMLGKRFSQMISAAITPMVDCSSNNKSG